MSAWDRFLPNMAVRDRRAILLGLVVLAPVLLWIAAVRPYRAALAGLHDRAETERSLFAREQHLLSNAAALPDSLAVAMLQAERADSRLVYAPNEPLAETAITTHLEGIARRSRVLLKDIGGLNSRPDPGLPPAVQPIRLSVRGESDLVGVLAFLQQIEEGSLLLSIEELSIQPVPDPGENPGAVEFSFAIEGYSPRGPAEGSETQGDLQ